MSDGRANCHRCSQRELLGPCDNYIGASAESRASMQGNPDYRFVRGGSWSNDPDLVRAAVRMKRIVDTLGFRVVRTFFARQD